MSPITASTIAVGDWEKFCALFQPLKVSGEVVKQKRSDVARFLTLRLKRLDKHLP